MRWYVSRLSLIIFLTGFNPIVGSASHLLGSSVSWEPVGNDKFKISVKAYRECDGENLVPPTPSIRCKKHNRDLDPPMNRVSVKRDTRSPFCDKYCTNCKTDTCNNNQQKSQFGYRKVESTYIVDLSDVSCCKISFAYQNCCRENSLSTIKSKEQVDLYTRSWFNKCKASNLKANAFQSQPTYVACTNQPITIDYAGKTQALKGKAFDSVRYELIRPKKAKDQLIGWKQPYSYQKPIHFKSFPERSKSLPSGFHFDNANGYLRFQPSKKQETIFGVAATYYSNGKSVGQQQRDFVFKSINCRDNHTPKIQGFRNSEDDTLSVCPLDTAIIPIKGTDADNQDQLNAKWDLKDLPGSVIKISRKSLNENETLWKLKWLPPESVTKQSLSNIRLQLKDDNCRLSGKTSKTLTVQLLPRPSPDFNVKPDNCKSLQVNSQKNISPTFEQEWFANNDTLGKGAKSNFSWDTAGQYTIKHRISSGKCKAFKKKQVDLFNLSQIAINKDTLCSGSSFGIKAKPPEVYSKPYQLSYTWLDKKDDFLADSKQFSLSLDSAQPIQLITEAKNQSGQLVCKDSTLQTVQVKQSPEVELKPLPDRCANTPPILLSDYVQPKGGVWKNENGNILDNPKIYPNQLGEGSHQFSYTVLNSTTGCQTTKKGTLSIKPVNKPDAVADTAICYQNQPLKLPAKDTGGQLVWGGNGIEETDSGYYFMPKSYDLPSDKYILTGSFQPEANRACFFEDSVVVRIYKKDQFRFEEHLICPNQIRLPKTFDTLPSQGYWITNSSDFRIENNAIQRDPNDSGKRKADYQLNPQCRIAKDVPFQLIPKKPVQIEKPSSKDSVYCLNDKKFELKAIPSGGQWNGPGIDSGNNFSPSEAGKGKHELTYLLPHDENRCLTIEKRKVTINQPPEFDFSNNLNFKCPDQHKLELAPDHKNITDLAFYLSSQPNGDLHYTQLGHDSFEVSLSDIPQSNDTIWLISKASGKPGCALTNDTLPIIRQSKPQLDILQQGDRTACKFVEGSLSFNSPDSIANVTWYVRNNRFDTPQLNYKIRKQGKHTLGLLTTSAKGCRDTLWRSGFFNVKSAPDVKIQPGKSKLYLSEELTVQAFPERADINYDWQIFHRDSSVHKLDGNPIKYNPQDTGNHDIALQVKTGKRCKDSVFQKQAFDVLRRPFVFIPEAFTPNGDGHNDKFRVEGQNIEKFKLTIYSRSGTEVYRSNSYEDHGWNGTYQNSTLPSDSYWYFLTVKGGKGEKKKYTGTIQLIR